MHNWGDDWPYWNELYEAQNQIGATLRMLTLCRLICKEKYGSIRYEYILPPGGRLFYSSKYYKLQCWWNRSILYRYWCHVGWKILVWIVLRKVKKQPYLKDELLEDIASNEALVGKKLHDEYWKTL